MNATITPTNRMKIEGVPAVEYAAQWGCGTADGVLFYNCSDADRYGRVVPNPNWEKPQWLAFQAAAARLHTRVAASVAAGETNWTTADVRNLEKLVKWAEYYANTFDTRGNWR